MRKVFFMVLMLAAVIGTQYMIARDQADVAVSRERLAGNPVDRYAAVGAPQGTVVVAHGFAGSKELMQYWGFTLARQGFDTYLFDQPGHGEQTVSLPEWRTLAENPLGQNLQAMVAELVETGRAQPGKIALVGHAMGANTVVATALVDPAVAATVAVSAAYSEPLPAGKPDHLLSLVASTNPITILYDADVLDQASTWIHKALGTTQPGPVGAVAPWGWILAALAGGLGAVLAVAWLLAPPAARRGSRPVSLGFFSGLVTLAVAALSAALAAVYLRLPQLGLAVADYLLPYFAVAALTLMLLRVLWPRDFGFTLTQGTDTVSTAMLRGLGIALAYLGAVVPVVHMNLTYHMLTLPRLVPMLVFAIVLWLYFVQEEGLKRAVINQWGALSGLVLGMAAKLMIVGTWMGAAALPSPPEHLPLIIPVTMAVLMALELLAAVLQRMHFSSATTATVIAIVLAWSASVTFPLL